MALGLTSLRITAPALALVAVQAADPSLLFAEETKPTAVDIVSTSAKSNVRDMFYAPSSPSAPQGDPFASPSTPVALRYRITLKDSDGDVRQVTEKFRFSTGDQVRLTFESNIDGYLYLFLKGSSGKVHQMFPHEKIQGGSNKVRKYSALTIPPKSGDDRGWFKFDREVGTEVVYAFLSPVKIEGFDSVLPSKSSGSEIESGKWAMVENAGGSDKGNAMVEFESDLDEDPSEDVPSVGYLVSKTAVLKHKIELRHGH